MGNWLNCSIHIISVYDADFVNVFATTAKIQSSRSFHFAFFCVYERSTRIYLNDVSFGTVASLQVTADLG